MLYDYPLRERHMMVFDMDYGFMSSLAPLVVTRRDWNVGIPA